MTVGADTYVHDLIRLCGGANVFAERGDRRYPRVAEAEIVAAAPEVVLLPDEPYRFDDRDAARAPALDLPAARDRPDPLDRRHPGLVVRSANPRGDRDAPRVSSPRPECRRGRGS